MSVILEATGVGITVGKRRLVDGVSLTLSSGELMVVVGPNGAGKTTLMKLLTGELAPTEGEIRLDRDRLGDLPAWRLAGKRAVMAQATRLAFPFTVVEVVRIGIDSVGRSLPRAERERLIAEALRSADIEDLAARNYQTLSGGEQQRVQFARTFAQLKAGRRGAANQVMFLDEPVASLDLAHQIALMEAAVGLVDDGVAVIAVLHDLNLAATFADRILVMHRGRAHAVGKPAEVITRDLVATIFGVDLVSDAVPPGALPVVLPQNYARSRATRGGS
ncbi:heme ABC transporter ATP-binding protein [Phreatobacter stygius]|uniref:Heme ABC transporter ATP-binding protein n=1 Tax=Phreatobacter stygius TaxID=1940610 RepID=A0A4D7B2B6_9HYPH|nr:heme ABC transporter ATP-binding protein [Phreatobacter stygius]QCI67879.1 heme ABC transporter ATP-binding protein [Phreatobacter stygius]